MKLLDLFCGEGGASVGYANAGFKIYGIDNDPKRLETYPFPYILGDVIQIMTQLLAGEYVEFSNGEELTLEDFTVAHASPPCTGYSRGTAALPDRLTRYDRLIAVTRELLQETQLHYIIENVADARRELQNPLMLCGRMFGLEATDDDGTRLVLDRHRLFETSFPAVAPEHLKHDRSLQVAGLYGGARRNKEEARLIRKGGYVPPNIEVQRKLGGTPWASEKGCWLAIPPAYSEYIARQFLANPRTVFQPNPATQLQTNPATKPQSNGETL